MHYIISEPLYINLVIFNYVYILNFYFFFFFEYYFNLIDDINFMYPYFIYDMRLQSQLFSFFPFFFKPLQTSVLILNQETSLVFFRIWNPNAFDLIGFSTYTVSPLVMSIFLNKVQCFCFENIWIPSLQTYDLPILFFFHSFFFLRNSSTISMIYSFFTFLLK